MTREEAIEILKMEITSLLENPWVTVDNKLVEANNVAMRALEEIPRTREVVEKIKTIIDNWAVDDDEHELLEQIAEIIGEA